MSYLGVFEGYSKAVAITPSNSTDLDAVTNAIWVGSTGNVAAVLIDGSVVTFNAVPDGTLLPVRAARVNSTGTTATNMVALYSY